MIEFIEYPMSEQEYIGPFLGRRHFVNGSILSDKMMKLGVKFDITVNNLEYRGIMPIKEVYLSNFKLYYYEVKVDVIVKEGTNELPSLPEGFENEY